MTDISDLQRRLLALGYEPGPIDGVLGSRTTAGVIAFQEDHGLVVDGKAGPQTWMALRAASEPAKPGKPEPDKSAIARPISIPGTGMDAATPPPNVHSLVLRSTARPISEIIVHCTATAEGRDFTVDDIRAWHKARGWSDIGYHYIVYRDGSIHEGRPVGQVGAHVEGRNTGTIGISYVGGVSSDGKTPQDTRTAPQRASLLWLVGELRKRHKGIRAVTGHNQYAAKACPSFDVRRDALSRYGA